LGESHFRHLQHHLLFNFSTPGSRERSPTCLARGLRGSRPVATPPPPNAQCHRPFNCRGLRRTFDARGLWGQGLGRWVSRPRIPAPACVKPPSWHTALASAFFLRVSKGTGRCRELTSKSSCSSGGGTSWTGGPSRTSTCFAASARSRGGIQRNASSRSSRQIESTGFSTATSRWVFTRAKGESVPPGPEKSPAKRKFMRLAGIEPATSRSGGARSIP
jgi:hypothetical protein